MALLAAAFDNIFFFFFFFFMGDGFFFLVEYVLLDRLVMRTATGIASAGMNCSCSVVSSTVTCAETGDRAAAKRTSHKPNAFIPSL